MSVIIRLAEEEDLRSVSQLAMRLTQQHQSYNPRRFVNFDNHEEQLYELFKWEIRSAETVICVAELDNRIVGYAFVRVEEASLIEISERSAWLHDIYVDEAARGLHVGKLLMQAAREAAREQLGSKVLMLHVAPQNERARKVFESYGFQPTMLEMMLDLSEGSG